MTQTVRFRYLSTVVSAGPMFFGHSGESEPVPGMPQGQVTVDVKFLVVAPNGWDTTRIRDQVEVAAECGAADVVVGHVQDAFGVLTGTRIGVASRVLNHVRDAFRDQETVTIRIQANLIGIDVNPDAWRDAVKVFVERVEAANLGPKAADGATRELVELLVGTLVGRILMAD